MLVLSRKIGESVVLEYNDIKIIVQLVDIAHGKARV